MAKVRDQSSSANSAPMRPALTPEARENQLISLAVDQAEKQLREGTASSQVITHFLKMATAKYQLENKILEQQEKLIAAKTEAIESAKRVEALYADALKAMRTYTGQGDSDDY